MDILSFSTTAPHFLHSSAATSLSFSLKPPPPPPEPTDSANSSPSLRRPRTLKPTPTSSTPKIPKNPLKTQITPSTAASLSAKLWLSSKLSPPPPPPPPPPERGAIEEQNYVDNETPEAGFRQEGKIFVGNLPNWIKKPELTEFFRQFGPIKSVILIRGHNEIERNAGFGFIIYEGPTADNSAMKAVEFDGMEFHGRVLTVKLDDGRRSKAKAEERKRWMEGEEGREFSSKWHEDREGSRKAFRKVLETQPENWQAVVCAFERVKKV